MFLFNLECWVGFWSLKGNCLVVSVGHVIMYTENLLEPVKYVHKSSACFFGGQPNTCLSVPL